MWNGHYLWIYYVTLIIVSVVQVCSSGSTECLSYCKCSNIRKAASGDASSDGIQRKRVSCQKSNESRPLHTIEELTPIAAALRQEIVYLDLSNNEITSIKKDGFLGLHNLERLNLSKNNIALVEPGAFNGLEKLQRLDISMNRLTYLNNTVFSGLNNIERINLGGNKIRTISAGTFDELPSLQRLILGKDQIRCDCHIKWLPLLIKENNKIKLLNSTCGSPAELKGKPIKQMKKLHCDWPLELVSFRLTPSSNQIVFQGDRLPFECTASASEIKPTLTWYRMGEPVKSNKSLGIYVHSSMPEDSLFAVSQLMLEKLTPDDNGVWKCVAHNIYGNKTLSVNIVVIPFGAVICPANVIHTNRGIFKWNKAIESTTPTIDCPFAGEAMSTGKRPQAFYTCNRAGQWEGLMVENCPYASLVTRILQQCAEINDTLLVDKSVGLKSIITDAKNITDKDDVIFIATIMERLLKHMGAENYKELSEVMLYLASVLIDVESTILYEAQLEERACFRIISVMEKIPAKQLEYKKSANGYSQNIAFYAYKVHESKYAGTVCKSTFSSGVYTQQNFICEDSYSPVLPMNTDVEASIHIPAKMFEFIRCLFNVCDKSEPFKIEVIIYRKGSLFPSKVKNSGRVVHSAVLSAKIVQTKELVVENITEPIQIQLRSTSKGTNPQGVLWDFSMNDGFGGWVPHRCSIQEQYNEGKNLSLLYCSHLTNFAVIQSVVPPPGKIQDWLAKTFNMSPMVYAGSCVLVICVLATAITYMVCRSSMQMPKKMKHCIPNMCLAIISLCVTYTIGVKTMYPELFCKVIAISIHYFSLCVLFWMDITSYVMYKKFKKAQLPPKPPDPDAPVKPVLGIYLLGWGLALILCGIVAAINSLQHYSNPQYCFLQSGARIFAFYIPAGCLVLINVAFWLCICCTIQSSSLPSHLDEPETEEIPVDDDYTTNIDSITPTTNMDSITPVITCRNPSQMSNLTSNNSQYSSIMDIQYKPKTQLYGMLIFLVLCIVTWFSGALAVNLPFKFIHQEIVFNCVYLVCSVTLGIFMIVFFVFGRKDGKDSWHRTCCCDKSDEYELNGSNLSNSLYNANGHIVRSASSLEGSQYTNKSSNTNRSMSNPYRYGPVGPCYILNTNPPPLIDTSVVSSVPEYPNFFNAKQNGIAKKYWQKHRQKHRIAQLNRDLKKNAFTKQKDANSRVSFDDSSDQNTHISLEIQLEPRAFTGLMGNGIKSGQTLYPNLGQYGVSIDGPKDGSTPPLLVPYERYQMAPMVGVSSPPSTIALLPPDGGSFISTELSGPGIPPAPMTSPQSSGINYIPSSHSLPRPQKSVVPISQYMQRNGSVPRLRDFDGKSSTSRETRPLSIGSDSQTMESFYRQNNHYNNRIKAEYQPPYKDLNTSNGKGRLNDNGNRVHDKTQQHFDHFKSSDQGSLLKVDTLFVPSNSSGTYSKPQHTPLGFLPQQTDTNHRIVNDDNLYRHQLLLNDSANNNNSSSNSGSANVNNCSSKPPIMPKRKQSSDNSTANQFHLNQQQSLLEQSHNPKHHKRKSSSSAELNVPGISNLILKSVNNVDESDTNSNLLPSFSEPVSSISNNNSNGSKHPEMEGLLSVERNMNDVPADEGALSDIWKPQRPSLAKLKNMETCV